MALKDYRLAELGSQLPWIIHEGPRGGMADGRGAGASTAPGHYARAPGFTIASRSSSILLVGSLLDGRMRCPGRPRSGAGLRT